MKRAAAILFLLSSLIARTAAPASISLAWDPSADSTVTGYTLYFGLTPSGPTNSVDVGNVTITTITGLTAGTTYFFFVTAYNAAGLESDPSNVIEETPSDNTVPVVFSRLRVNQLRIGRIGL